MALWLTCCSGQQPGPRRGLNQNRVEEVDMGGGGRNQWVMPGTAGCPVKGALVTGLTSLAPVFWKRELITSLPHRFRLLCEGLWAHGSWAKSLLPYVWLTKKLGLLLGYPIFMRTSLRMVCFVQKVSTFYLYSPISRLQSQRALKAI